LFLRKQGSPAFGVHVDVSAGKLKKAGLALKLPGFQADNQHRAHCSVRQPWVCCMKDTHTLPFVDVDALRIGMFVHIELGWMSHPFPLSSFRITSADQIATIRGLGLKRLRWSPQLSEAGGNELPEPKPAGQAEKGLSSVPVDESAQAVAIPVETPVVESPAEQAKRRHRENLAAQRESLLLCEKQFSEATRAYHQITDSLGKDAAEAGTLALSLSRAMINKMLGKQELSIRLLTEAAGDKASAHAVNVTLISILLGRTFGWSEADMLDLGVGALLHDVGKLDLPDRLRHHESQFSPSESKVYEEHVGYGVARARKMGLSAGASQVIAQHHEMADGSGFPLHLGNERMSMAARVVALVNRYDNLCNPNMISRAMTPHEALSLIFAQTSHHFDATILSAFIRMMGVYPAGSLVQLTDGRFAMVVGVNSSRPLKPRLLVHEPKVPREEALILNLEHRPELGIRRSVKPMALPADSLVYLSPRQRVAYFFEPSGSHEPELEAA
jgi:putative nucleotidyltransferase with HDIG domain